MSEQSHALAPREGRISLLESGDSSILMRDRLPIAKTAPMSPARLEANRLSFLDCIRGIAALAVLLEHAGERISPHLRDFSHDRFSLGKFGVTAFFLTS